MLNSAARPRACSCCLCGSCWKDIKALTLKLFVLNPKLLGKKKRKSFECLPRQKVMVKSLILRFTRRFTMVMCCIYWRGTGGSGEDFPGLMLVWRKAKRRCNGVDGGSNPTCAFPSLVVSRALNTPDGCWETCGRSLRQLVTLPAHVCGSDLQEYNKKRGNLK